MGLNGFDLTSVQEACKTTETLLCAAFERTDGWALALKATVPAVVAVAGYPPDPATNLPGMDSVIAYHYGIWFAFSEYAYVIDTTRTDDSETSLANPPSQYPFTATPTATAPDDDAVISASEDGLLGCDWGLCPGFFELGDFDDITSSDTQTVYVYNLQSGFENDGSSFEVGDTIDIWSIDTSANKNTHTEAFIGKNWFQFIQNLIDFEGLSTVFINIDN